jgi:putative Mg2+ transporter-C (MgtC) family protein
MSEWELPIRLTLAALAGVVVGLERELRGHPAGMRTHTLVAMGAAIFTLAGAYGFPEFERSNNIDPARLAAQVASGIGFIGAGAILRDGGGVRGITTASTLWLSAALGVAAGAALYLELAFATGLVLVVLTALRLVKPVLQRYTVSSIVLDLEYQPGNATLGSLIVALNDLGARVQHLRVSDREHDVDSSTETHGLPLRRVRVPVAVRDTEQLYDRCHSFPSASPIWGWAWPPPYFRASILSRAGGPGVEGALRRTAHERRGKPCTDEPA